MVLRPQLLNSLSSRHLGSVCCHFKRQLLPQTQQRCLARADAAFVTSSSAGTILSGTGAQRLLCSEDLLHYLKQRNIQASLLHQPSGISAAQVIKTMILIIKPAAADSTAQSSTGAFSDCEAPLAVDTLLQPPQTNAVTAAAAAAAAVVVLVPGDQKVDLSRVAQHLGIARRSLRLARRHEAAAVTGYQVGGIPPLGHRVPLCTLIDNSILKQQEQPLYAGGGDPSSVLQLSLQQVLEATAAEPGVFVQPQASGQHSATFPAAITARSSDGTGVSDSNDQPEEQQQQRPQQGARAPAVTSTDGLSQLPLPWIPGSDSVELVGVIAQKRRMARLLLFCSLVPESVPPLPACGTAAYVRRLWRHPEQHTRAEVQLILGKTLERKLGREAAAALFDHIKVGAIVYVRGTVQQNPAALRQQQPDSGTSSSSDVGGVRGVVLDVVAHEVRFLHKNKDSLARAIRAAQRQGFADATSALQLMRVQEQQLQQQMSVKEPAETAAVNGNRHDSSRGGHGGQIPTSSRSNAVKSLQLSSTLIAGTHKVRVTKQQQQQQPAAAAAAPGDSGASSAISTDQSGDNKVPGLQEQYWQLPLATQHVHWVADLEGIQRMRQSVLGHIGHSTSTNTNGSLSSNGHTSSSSSGGDRAGRVNDAIHKSRIHDDAQLPCRVMGIDCEWKPYDKNNPANPVALLQLATRTDIFLVDLLAVCQQQQQQQRAACKVGLEPSNHTCVPPAGSDVAGSDVAGNAPVLCTAAESALGDFLLCVLSSEDVVKVGFGLAADLARLQQSYPHLPCFQPSAVTAAGIRPASASGAAPLARHIDLLQLSRLAAPSIHKSTTSMSLSRLAAAVLGKPLDKTQQISNWEQRPLSHQQQVYAAVDGHVLTVVFDALLQKWLAAGGDIDVLDRLSAANAVKYLPITKVQSTSTTFEISADYTVP